MIVRLKGDISGTRDGLPWPPRGSTIELPDDEATQLCANGMATPVPADELEVETAVVVPVDEEHRLLTTENGPGRRSRK